MFDQARKNMVEGQVRPNGVTSPKLLEALHALPRERFVPRHLQSIAYVDEDISLGSGRYLQEPMVLARLAQAANIQGDDVVLDIGCGTGYSSAVLGALAGTVVGLEHDRDMAWEAEKLLRDLGIVNAVVVHHKDLREGYSQQGPYNVIVINGSVASVPDKIKSQLAEGGRLVTVLSKEGHMGSAVMITRRGDTFSMHALFDAATPTLQGFEAPKTFVF